MSLITSASAWTNDDVSPKKRVSSMRKTVKKIPQNIPSNGQNPTGYGSLADYSNQEMNYQESQLNSLNEVQAVQEDRNTRVNQLLNQMAYSGGGVENAGNSLANFQPLSHPIIQKRTDVENHGREEDPAMISHLNPLQIPPPTIRSLPGGSNFAANAQDLGNFGNNYRMAYEHPKNIVPSAEYYGRTGGHSIVDNKLMEKINYMIHMLEQQHNEKTSNITEEFVLYIFLGVFIIFIVDSFARAGKYIR